MLNFNTEELSILFRLLLAHIISDYYLQKSEWSHDKKNNNWRSRSLYKHIFITFLASFFLTFQFWASILIAFVHFIIDLTKSYNKKYNRYFVMILDQTAHIVTIFTIWYFLINYYPGDFSENKHSVLLLKLSAYAFAIFSISFPFGIFVDILAYKWKLKSGIQKQAKISNIIERTILLILIFVNQIPALILFVFFKLYYKYAKNKHWHPNFFLIDTVFSLAFTFALGFLVRFTIT